jgi:Ni/Co efflux regulator RcnB
MNTWRKKFFAFLLAFIAISVFAGPIAVSTSAAPTPAAQSRNHRRHPRHRRHHPRRRHHG